MRFTSALLLGVCACHAGRSSPPPPGTSDARQHLSGRWQVALAIDTIEADADLPPVSVAAWIPVQASAGVSVSVEDLWNLARREESGWALAEDSIAALQVAMTGDSSGDRRAIRELLQRRLRATWHSGSPAQRFPLVAWGVRHGTTLAQAELSLELASHGFVVVSAWPVASRRVDIWDRESVARKRETIDVDARSLGRAISYAAKLWGADTMRLTLLAWSYGGQSVAALSHGVGVRGIVSLDANVVAFDSAEVDPSMRVPLLLMAGRDTTRRAWTRWPTLGPAVTVLRLPELSHGNFNALEGYYPASLALPRYWRWSSGGVPAVAAQATLADIVVTTVSHWNGTSPLSSLKMRLQRDVPASAEWR